VWKSEYLQALVGLFMVENGFRNYQEAKNGESLVLLRAEQRIKRNQNRMTGSA
jgi:hypothetical protein